MPDTAKCSGLLVSLFDVIQSHNRQTGKPEYSNDRFAHRHFIRIRAGLFMKSFDLSASDFSVVCRLDWDYER